MSRFYSLLTTLIVAGLSLFAQPTVSAQTAERCFDETGFCISGRIREYWEQNGGLAVFGLPVGPQQQLQSDGKTVDGQWFERHRLELHPENARPYDVLLGRLGVDRLAQQGRDWFAFPKSEPQPECRYFPETGHNVCGEILTAWRASGVELDGRRGKTEAESLALFGLPLSDAVQETIEGREYTVQWFERARFELHPENQGQGRVLLGLLGTEIHGVAPRPDPAAGRISGRAFRSDAQAPIVGAQLTLSDRALPVNDPARTVATATTDAQGRFGFASVRPGTYGLVLSATFASASDLPCTQGIYTTPEGHLAVTGRRADGSLVVTVSTRDISVPAKGDIAVTIDLSCKQ